MIYREEAFVPPDSEVAPPEREGAELGTADINATGHLVTNPTAPKKKKLLPFFSFFFSFLYVPSAKEVHVNVCSTF